MYANSIDLKKSAQLDLNPRPQVSCTTHWAIGVVVFDGMLLEFSPFLCLQPAVERNVITALPRSDKPKVGRWWVCGVRLLICCFGSPRRVIGMTDRQMDSFLASYIDYMFNQPIIVAVFSITHQFPIAFISFNNPCTYGRYNARLGCSGLKMAIFMQFSTAT